MPEHTAAPSEQTAPMRLAKILDSFIPGMHDTPCRIAIFTDGRKIKVFERSISAGRRSIPASADLGTKLLAGAVSDSAGGGKPSAKMDC